MIKTFNTIIQLRRDNDYNYESVKNTFIPLNGEVVLVDTVSKGLRFKIGDGETTYQNLPFIDQESQNQIVMGYYFNNNFYEDNHYLTIIAADENKYYIDKTSNQAYLYNGETYILINYAAAQATDLQPGVMKLYQVTGQNIDGTMSQKSISDELNLRYKTSVDNNQELLSFYI